MRSFVPQQDPNAKLGSNNVNLRALGLHSAVICVFAIILAVTAYRTAQHSVVHLQLTAEETRLINPNTLAYSAMHVLNNGGTVQTFWFPQHPDIRPAKLNISAVEEWTIPSGAYQYWARHLVKGSTINTHITWVDLQAEMRLFVVNSLDEWVRSPARKPQATGTTSIQYTVEARETGDHYVILYNPKADHDSFAHTLHGNATFNVSLIQHDVAKAEDIFYGSFESMLGLGSTQFFIVQNPSTDSIASVDLQLVPRNVLFVLVFMVAVLSYIVCCCDGRLAGGCLSLLKSQGSGDSLFTEEPACDMYSIFCKAQPTIEKDSGSEFEEYSQLNRDTTINMSQGHTWVHDSPRPKKRSGIRVFVPQDNTSDSRYAPPSLYPQTFPAISNPFLPL